jgi:hypothetical protein
MQGVSCLFRLGGVVLLNFQLIGMTNDYET